MVASIKTVSENLLIASTINVIFIIVLGIRVISRYQSLPEMANERAGGILFFYRLKIGELFNGEISLDGLLYLLQYILVHLIVPFLGFGLLLRTDANFLIVLLSLFWSSQLLRRIFPG